MYPIKNAKQNTVHANKVNVLLCWKLVRIIFGILSSGRGLLYPVRDPLLLENQLQCIGPLFVRF